MGPNMQQAESATRMKLTPATPICAHEAVARKFHLTPIQGGRACKSSEHRWKGLFHWVRLISLPRRSAIDTAHADSQQGT